MQYETYDVQGGIVKEVNNKPFILCFKCPSVNTLTPVPKRPSLSVRLPEKAKHISAPEPVEARLQKHETLTVHFAFNSAVLKSSEKRKIDAAIPTTDRIVSVTGYTCSAGSKEYNDNLASKRALYVSSYLKKKGVLSHYVGGKGKCCYVSDLSGKNASNRRVEIIYLPGSPVERSQSRLKSD